MLVLKLENRVEPLLELPDDELLLDELLELELLGLGSGSTGGSTVSPPPQAMSPAALRPSNVALNNLFIFCSSITPYCFDDSIMCLDRGVVNMISLIY